MSADLADSQRADEEERKTNHAPLDAAKKQETATVTIQTNFLEGDLKTEVDGMKGNLTETETENNEASSEWEEEDERQKSRADELRSRLLLRKLSPQSIRRFLWPCDSTGVFVFPKKTTSLSGILVFDPARRRHIPDNEFKIAYSADF